MLHDMTNYGVLDRTILVYGQMNEPPGARWRVPLTAMTIAEYFRDRGQHALIVVDDSFTAPLGRVSNADEQAAALVFLGSRAAGYISGQVLWTDGGILAQRFADTLHDATETAQAPQGN